MQRSFAILFGVAFIIFGIFGFIPSLTEHGQLFGLFRLNFEHNVTHLTFGAMGILAGLSSKTAARTYFIISGIVFGILAFLGFREETDMIFQMIAINTADNYLHAGLSALFLIIGLKPSSQL